MLGISTAQSAIKRLKSGISFKLPARVSTKDYFSKSVSKLVQDILKNALDETAASVRPHVGWLNGGISSHQNFAESPLNCSGDFREICSKIENGEVLENWPASASPYAFVFVGGLWSHFYPFSYDPTLDGLSLKGINTERFKHFDTRHSVEANSPEIAAELRRVLTENPKKKLIIMAHSKGSLDTLEAVRVDPAIAPRIHRLISIQSPFGGSPYAGAFLDSDSVTKKVVDALIIQWMAGDYSGMKSLTYEARKEWFDKKMKIDQIPIPVLCFATSAMPKGDLPEELGAYINDTFHMKNDGLVVEMDAVLPGSPFVLANGISHIAPVFNDIPYTETLPSVCIEALCYMATNNQKYLDSRLSKQPTL